MEIGAPPIGTIRNTRRCAALGKTCKLVGHLISGKSLRRSVPVQETWFKVKPFIHISQSCLLRWLFLKHFLDCHGILILGKGPINWRQRPYITMAADWDVTQRLKKCFASIA